MKLEIAGLTTLDETHMVAVNGGFRTTGGPPQITIFDGDAPINNIRQRTAREPIQQVTDTNHGLWGWLFGR